MTKRTLMLLFTLCCVAVGLYGQPATPNPTYSGLPGSEAVPRIALKTNLPYNLLGSFNLGVEIRTSSHTSLDLSGSYNPFTFRKKQKLKHGLLQPEVRYWINEVFNRHFIGTHLIYTRYNVGNNYYLFRGVSSLKQNRFQGHGYGAGVSYGYQWIASPRFNLELSLGVGYLYFNNSTYEKEGDGLKIKNAKVHYVGPTKLGFSLIYVL